MAPSSSSRCSSFMLTWALTEDSEFQYFLDSLAGLSRSKDGWAILGQLGNDGAADLDGRIISLLRTCDGMAASADLQKQERAMTCCQSMALLATARTTLPQSVQSKKKGAKRGALLAPLNKLIVDENPTIRRYATSTALILVHEYFSQMRLNDEHASLDHIQM